MSKEEHNLTCPICKGVKIYRYERKEAVLLSSGRTFIGFCYCLPSPAQKHDGFLDLPDHPYQSHAQVGMEPPCSFSHGRRLVVIHGGYGESWEDKAVRLDPKQALSLRDWLVQESPELERLTKEQEA